MISKRLLSLTKYIEGENIADIGTDHGFVPVFLRENTKIKKIIATDISKASLEKSIELAKIKNIKDIDFRVGDGIKVLEKNEVDTIIIAGMGGILISKILEESSEIAKKVRLILQPMQASEELRTYLCERGFEIIDEEVIFEDKRYFEIIVAKYDGKIRKLKKYENLLPLKAIEKNEEEAMNFVKFKIEKNLQIMENLKGNTKKPLIRYMELKGENNYFKEVINGKSKRNN